MPQSVRVLLVDTPALPRSCLATVLNRRRWLHVVGEVGTGGDALAEVHSLQPNVVVVDPDVPGGGTKLVSDLVEQLQGGAVVVLAHAGAVAPDQALQAGARGYLEKDCDADAVARTIDRVHEGELVVPQSSMEEVMRTLGAASPRTRHTRELSEREREVLRLVARGCTNREIAAELIITEHTVKAHLAKIQRKLALSNRFQLTSYAVQNGYLEPTQSKALGTPSSNPRAHAH